MAFRTPVAVIFFNRPKLLKQLFDVLAVIQPKVLLLIADGPRGEVSLDMEKCAEARDVVAHVSWDCEVYRDYADANLGCGLRPATGVTRVFEQVQEAIILEDDCIPHPDFFTFCEGMLDRYRNNPRIAQVCGHTFGNSAALEDSYFFSQHNVCAGAWATWRESWSHFDIALREWPDLKPTSWLRECVRDPRAVQYWERWFDLAAASGGEVDYWDYQWTFACWRRNALSIVPRFDLVTNIGFGPDATHTKSSDHLFAHRPAVGLDFPLRHPPFVRRDRRADDQFIQQRFGPRPTLLRRLKRAVSRNVPDSLRKQLLQVRSKVL